MKWTFSYIIISRAGPLYGPFKTAQAAVEWGFRQFADDGAWYVQPLRKPN